MIHTTFALLLSTVAAAPSGVSASDVVVMEFTSQNCPPCRSMEPVINQLLREGVPVRKIDARSQRNLFKQFRVTKTPTFLIMRGTREHNRLEGRQSLTQLRRALQQASISKVKSTSARTRPRNRDLQPTTPLVPIHADGMVMPTTDVANAIEQARAATVRLKVSDSEGFGVGTGTIIDVHGSESLILTCGHLFRNSGGKGPIEVEIFNQGRILSVPGKLIDFDAGDRDVALVSFKPGISVQPVKVMATDGVVKTGDLVFSFGCDHGETPSLKETRITGVNKYEQQINASNFEIEGAPAVGRSGGGLFDREGRLIGVCNSADFEGDVGIYAGPGFIRWQIDRLNLSHLYRDNGPTLQTRLASLPGRPQHLGANDPPPTRRHTAPTNLGSSSPNRGAPVNGAAPSQSRVIVIVQNQRGDEMHTFERMPKEIQRLINARR